MKTKIIALLLLICSLSSQAQTIQQISQKDTEKAMPDMERLLKDQIGTTVKLVGLGDVATLAKETQQFNTSLCAYLISKKDFRHIILLEDEWLVRPLNDYLTNGRPADTAKLTSLMLRCLSGPDLNNDVFRYFLTWVKKYNLSHKASQVNLYGGLSNTSIPSSYLVAAYVYPVDAKSAEAFAKKWDRESNTESQCLQDINQWYLKISKTKTRSPIQKLLLQSCGNDIEHNENVLKIERADQKFTVDTLLKQTNYISKSIVEKTTQKTILFSQNRVVLKCDVSSSFVLGGKTMPSVGKLLDHAMHQAYYACVTDFCGPSKLPVVDIAAQAMNMETVLPSAQAKLMFENSDRYFQKSSTSKINDFLPAMVPFLKGFVYTMTYDKATVPFNALFLFKELSVSNPIPNQ